MDRAKDSMVVNEFGSIREMSRTVYKLEAFKMCRVGGQAKVEIKLA